ncbi:tRNA(fMet)-specific endonuclease VapC [archaeon BMS3Abin16]|nr:tRNA(fMet)-specific endonuclease VapC [archaeon BMS3Abin16]
MMFIDSFAWIEYFMGTERGRKVKKIIEGNVITYTSPTVIAEIFSKSVRTDGQDKARERVDFIVDRCVLIQTDENIAVEAGRLHGEMKPKIKDFGLADAFILASARSKGAKVVTGDPHFKDLDDTVFLD